MPNLYATLPDIKSSGMLNITASTYDGDLLDCLEEGSRQIDRDTERFFYIYEGTFYQDGGGNRVILDWDVQSISTLKVDADGDGNIALSSTYENSYNLSATTATTAIDAFLYPLNVTPKTRLEANPWGQFGSFGSGVRNAIRIIGVFGFGNDWPASYTLSNLNTLTSALNSTAVTLPVIGISTDFALETGQTLLLTASGGSTEQIYISVTGASTSYTVERGMNGTVGIIAGTTATIAVYRYPSGIKKATLIYAMRIWKRRESAFQNQVGNPELGTVTVWKGDDPDYVKTVKKYKKVKREWYIQ